MKQATNNLFYIDMIGCAHVRIRNICLKPYYYTAISSGSSGCTITQRLHYQETDSTYTAT